MERQSLIILLIYVILSLYLSVKDDKGCQFMYDYYIKLNNCEINSNKHIDN